MIQFLTGGKQQKVQKKVQNDINDIFKNQLKKQFCQICQKNPAAKVAFGKEFKPVFTCSGCQLKAVGGVPLRLGPKSLITNDKFSEELTKEIISYQGSNKNPSVQYKKVGESCQFIKDKTNDLTAKITQQYKKLKKIVKEKEDQLIEQSIKQNSIFIFQQVGKMIKQKKLNQLDSGYLILKKSQCNYKGLRFSGEEAIEETNRGINEKMVEIKKQSKVKLKDLEDLIDEINEIQFE